MKHVTLASLMVATAAPAMAHADGTVHAQNGDYAVLAIVLIGAVLFGVGALRKGN